MFKISESLVVVDWKSLHREAYEKRAHTYTDPATGYLVLTEYGHWERGHCCGSACRHCPWDHEAVVKEEK